MRQFKPVRKIGFQHRSITGVQPSLKNGDLISFESSLERDFITILNFDFCVSEFVEQPVEIIFNEDSNGRTYTPDFLVTYKNGFSIKQKPTLFEVKYRKDLFKDWKKLKPKFKAALEYADSKKWKFKIITEKEIRTDFLINAKFLWHYKYYTISSDDDYEMTLIILTRMKVLKVTTPQELMVSSCKSIMMRGKLLHTLWILIAKGQIGCDLNLRLNMNSEIWDIG